MCWGLENKCYVSTQIFPKTATLGEFLTRLRNFWLRKALTVAMLTYKLPLITIVVPCIVNRQIGVGESKYGVTGDLLLRDRTGVT